MQPTKGTQGYHKIGTFVAIVLIALAIAGIIYLHYNYGPLDVLIKDEINKYTDFFQTDKGEK